MLEATRSIGGIDDAQWAEVPHPLGSLTPEQLAQRARLAAEQFVDLVVADPEA